VRLVAAGNPIMESIVADTMKTTYAAQQQMESSNASAALNAPSIPSHDPSPEELTGDAAHWAAILDRVGV
jgi:hypothetical protein